MLNKKRAKSLFGCCILNAKKRGIPFLFSFEEWVKWWEDNLGPDWMSKRGRSNHQHQMARKGDKGPYRIDNVECITRAENLALVDRRGEKNGQAKLTNEEVLEIFNSPKGYRRLSREFPNISRRKIQRIRAGTVWTHITGGPRC